MRARARLHLFLGVAALLLAGGLAAFSFVVSEGGRVMVSWLFVAVGMLEVVHGLSLLPARGGTVTRVGPLVFAGAAYMRTQWPGDDGKYTRLQGHWAIALSAVCASGRWGRGGRR